MERTHLAMFSFGDIDNYGDILFANVFQMEMSKRLDQLVIDFYAPTDALVEGTAYRSYTRAKVEGRYDALILAGGEVVHFFDHRTWSPIYAKKNAVVESGRPSDVVWDWVDCRSPYKAWFAVGVRPFEGHVEEEKIRTALGSLDHLSVRGILSKKLLENGPWIGNDRRITITPDLGWFFPKYLEHSGELGQNYSALVGGEKNFVLYQVNGITEDTAQLICDGLLKFQSTYHTKVFLLPVIHPWEDVKYLRMVEQLSNGKLKLLSDKLTTLEMADLMVHAQVVLCSSLHMAITALAAGVPAGMITKWQGTKLQDLFAQQFRMEYLADDHGETFAMLEKLWAERKKRPSLLACAAFMRSSLDRAFDELVDGIRSAKIR